MNESLRTGPAQHPSDALDDQRIGELFADLFPRALRVAHKRLAGTALRIADEEDIALSAFGNLCAGMADGRVADGQSSQQLWRLLRVIVVQKTIDYQRRQWTQRRGGGDVRGESVFGGTAAESVGRGLEDVTDGAPDGVWLIMFEEHKQRLLSGLDDDTLRQVAIWKMEDVSNKQIAQRLGVCVRTVERKIRMIRKRWWVESMP